MKFGTCTKISVTVVVTVLLAMLVACQTETGVAKEIADKDPTFEISAVQLSLIHI